MNMTHCRFENTANDLEDCVNYLLENDNFHSLSSTEKKGLLKLLKLAKELNEEFELDCPENLLNQ